MQPGNVLPRRSRPTRNSYRSAVKKIILDLQAKFGLSDPEFAERVGCSKETIANVRNERNNLDAVTLANIEYEFGAGSIDPFLALGGSRAIPRITGCSLEDHPELALLDALRAIIATQQPDSDGGCETTKDEARQHLHTLRTARLALDRLITLGESAEPDLRVVA